MPGILGIPVKKTSMNTVGWENRFIYKQGITEVTPWGKMEGQWDSARINLD